MKRILIIGASSGIGAAVAKAAATKGWQVILHGRSKERLEAILSHLAGEGHTILVGDVVAWSEDPKSIPSIEPEDGQPSHGFGVQAIVWSAGICELAAGQMLGLKALRRTLSVNLEAPLVVLSHFYRKGIIQDGGTIVLLGSESAHDAGEGFSVYAASKGGLASAARVLGKEFGRRGVNVHCLEPGTVNTPMTKKLAAIFSGQKSKVEGQKTKGKGKRLGDADFEMVEPEDVAAEVVALLDNSSSRFAKATQDKHIDLDPQS